MALKCLVLFSLLVLGLLVLGGAQPPQVQSFQRKHMDTSPGPFPPTYCDQMMRRRNLTGRNFNTFVHESFQVVQAVCSQTNTPCKRRGWNNCFISNIRMSITECNLTQTRPPNYQTINCRKHIVIACSGNPPKPVHFDGSIWSPPAWIEMHPSTTHP